MEQANEEVNKVPMMPPHRRNAGSSGSSGPSNDGHEISQELSRKSASPKEDERLRYNIRFFRVLRDGIDGTESEYDKQLHAHNLHKRNAEASKNAPSQGWNRKNPVDAKYPDKNNWGNLRVAEKLVKTENHWSRNRHVDTGLQKKIKTLASILNKLTIEKFDKLSGKILDIELTTTEEVQAVIETIFEKALLEPKFGKLYTSLCVKLDAAYEELFIELKVVNEEGEAMTFKKILLNLVMKELQKLVEFNDGLSEGQVQKTPDSIEDKLLNLSIEEGQDSNVASDAAKAKKRSISNVLFLKELFLFGWVTEEFVFSILDNLLEMGTARKSEEVLEVFKALMGSVGERMSQIPDKSDFFEKYRGAIVSIAEDATYSPRLNNLFQALLQMPEKNWVLHYVALTPEMTGIDHELRKRVKDLPEKRFKSKPKNKKENSSNGGWRSSGSNNSKNRREGSESHPWGRGPGRKTMK